MLESLSFLPKNKNFQSIKFKAIHSFSQKNDFLQSKMFQCCTHKVDLTEKNRNILTLCLKLHQISIKDFDKKI